MPHYFRVDFADPEGLPDVNFVSREGLQESARRAIVAEVLAKGGLVKKITAMDKEDYDREKRGLGGTA